MTLFNGKFQIRRGTSALWASSDPVLLLGELGIDTDLLRMKMGDNVKTWSALAWASDPPFILPPSTGWTAMNTPTITADSNGRVQSQTAGATDNFKGEYRTLSPASNYTITANFDALYSGPHFDYGGFILKNSGGNSFIHFGTWASGSPPDLYLAVTKWTGVATFSATYIITAAWKLPHGIPSWLRIRDDATNRFFEMSYNRFDWVPFFSVGRTDFLTPDQIGWALSSNTGVSAHTSVLRLNHWA